MKLTKEDIPLMKLIFNPSTHAMGIMIGRERAEEIFNYVSNEIGLNEEDFIKNISRYYYRILWAEKLFDYFWDNNILNIQFLNGWGIYMTLRYSPIAEKIWESDKLDLTKLNGDDMYSIFTESPIAEKIWDSGKLNLSLLDEDQLEELKQNFELK